MPQRHPAPKRFDSNFDRQVMLKRGFFFFICWVRKGWKEREEKDLEKMRDYRLRCEEVWRKKKKENYASKAIDTIVKEIKEKDATKAILNCKEKLSLGLGRSWCGEQKGLKEERIFANVNLKRFRRPATCGLDDVWGESHFDQHSGATSTQRLTCDIHIEESPQTRDKERTRRN